MIRLTRLADYAVVLMSRIASQPEFHQAASELASDVRLPVTTVSKILKLLQRAGLLVSQRGPKGGYSISRPLGKKVTASKKTNVPTPTIDVGK